jgi:hypothetical protein
MTANSPLHYLKDIAQLFALERTEVSLGAGPNAQELYSWFTQPHANLPIFSNKTVGVQLIDLRAFAAFDDYLKSINGKNSAAYYRRKALSKGYTFALVDRNDYVDDIHAINLSLDTRQGRKMHPVYLAKTTHYEHSPGWMHFGVLNAQGTLTAYLDLQIANEVAVTRTLLGHGQHLNDGIMYLLLIEVARHLYATDTTRYLMYDMYFGTGQGLRLFKEKLGFKPYWVKWAMKSDF